MDLMMRRRALMGRGENGEVDYSKEYFTLTSLDACSFNRKIIPSGTPDVSYSVDKGKTWTVWSSSIDVPAGKNVLLKCTKPELNGSIGWIYSTGRFNASGNIMSIVYGDDFQSYDKVTCERAFGEIFRTCNTIVDASNLVFPTLPGRSACDWMFASSSLVYAPKLLKHDGTTYAENYGSYLHMFHTCTSLITAPEIVLINNGHNKMSQMFEGCTSLEVGPTIKVSGSFNSEGFTKLFYNCTNLKQVTLLAKTLNSYNTGFDTWLSGVAEHGIFTMPSNANWTTANVNVPEGWTVETVDVD